MIKEHSVAEDKGEDFTSSTQGKDAVEVARSWKVETEREVFTTLANDPEAFGAVSDSIEAQIKKGLGLEGVVKWWAEGRFGKQSSLVFYCHHNRKKNTYIHI